MSHPLARITAGPVDAPTLVLLHGITASALSQTDAIDHWTALGYRVVAVDARGHGLSPRWAPQELERAGEVLVDDAVAVLEDLLVQDRGRRALGLPATDPPVVIGHSMGAATAMVVAARRPELLVLDEPTAGLDPSAVDAALGLVERLMTELDATLLVITHDPAVAARLTSRVVEMRYGRLTNGVPAREVVTADRPGASRDGRTRGDAEPVLCVRSLTAGAPGLADPPVTGLDLDVLEGEAVALTGPSGSGKSTVARTLVGLWPRRDGEVTVAGMALPAKLDDWPRSARGTIGWVPQDPATSVNPAWSLGRSLARARTRAVRLGGAGTGVKEAAELVGLPPGWETRRPRQLSGGQLQRFAIARVLVSGARLLVLDEVTSSLDATTRDAICEVLAEVRKRIPMLVITHDPAVIARCDREIRLND